MKRIYITGAGGAVGQVLAAQLAPGFDVVSLDRARAPLPAADWFDPAWPDAAIVHLASETQARGAGDAAGMAAPHLEMAGRLAERGFRGRLVFLSSAAVYAGSETPIAESAPPDPPTVYGAHKLLVERGLAALAGRMGFTLTTLRASNIYGTPRDLDRRRVIALALDAALTGAPFLLYGDGTSRRDYLHVTDLCRAVEAALGAPPGLYNLGSGTGTSLAEVLRLAETATGRPLTLDRRPVQAEAASSVLDVTRAAEALGWRAKVPLADGVGRLAAEMAGRSA